jgi:exosortase
LIPTIQRPRWSRDAWLTGSVLALGILVAYWDVLRRLVYDWATNDDYSHGFVIVPLAVYFAWDRRDRLAGLSLKPSVLGLGIVAAGLLALAGGTLGVELFVARVSLLLVLAGCVVFLGGWAHLRVLAFPLAFLILMIPIPAIVFNRIAFPLQLIASQLGEAGLRLADIPVLREGNMIVLPNARLLVAEACSGIRSLVALLTLSIAYSYFAEPRRVIAAFLVAMTIPIALVTNGARVTALGIIARSWGLETAEGVFHTFSGWFLFVLAFVLLLGVHRVLRMLRFGTPLRPQPQEAV